MHFLLKTILSIAIISKFAHILAVMTRELCDSVKANRHNYFIIKCDGNWNFCNYDTEPIFCNYRIEIGENEFFICRELWNKIALIKDVKKITKNEWHTGPISLVESLIKHKCRDLAMDSLNIPKKL